MNAMYGRYGAYGQLGAGYTGEGTGATEDEWAAAIACEKFAPYGSDENDRKYKKCLRGQGSPIRGGGGGGGSGFMDFVGEGLGFGQSYINMQTAKHQASGAAAAAAAEDAKRRAQTQMVLGGLAILVLGGGALMLASKALK